MANVTYTVQNKDGSYDGDMVVKQYTSVIIDSGDTVTVDQPCRGLFILVKGDCTINGTLNMSARGAFADPTSSGGSDSNSVDSNGLRFPFVTDGGSESLTAADTLLNGCGTAARSVISNFKTLSSDGTIISIPRDGGVGGTGADAHDSITHFPGGVGGTVTNGTGGGGAGKAYYRVTTQDGGLAGCFGGGSGSGAARAYTSNETNSSSPIDYGGQGGQGQYYGIWDNVCGGGAGNPAGTSTGSSTSGTDGTGGVIILVVGGDVTIGASGKILANGSPGGVSGSDASDMQGGASGGGRIIIAYRGSYTNNGTVQAVGGEAATTGVSGEGGDGGVGTVTTQQVS
jgi:hypothetical protein|tara:strand:- start:126 stop:1151 length:1026 start_codon:yes stop_codon:yes gene_type:complete